VQCLANPVYLNYLATQKYFEKPEFVAYLDYLQYFAEPKYIKFLQYVYTASSSLPADVLTEVTLQSPWTYLARARVAAAGAFPAGHTHAGTHQQDAD
jgi:hypothetical protein